jgi:hypothetical protein
MPRAMKPNGLRRGPEVTLRPRTKRDRIPVWDKLLKIAHDIPKADLHKLPTDLSARHDHYLFGDRLG